MIKVSLKSNFLKILINTLIGVGLVFIWLQFVDINKIIEELKTANLSYVFPAFLALLLGVVVRSLKLQVFLFPIKKIALKDLFFLTGAANLFNFLIPIRAGEVLKGVYLGSNYGLPISKTVIWIFLDRFIDFLVVLILAIGLFFFVPTTLPQSFIATVIAIFFVVIIISLLMIFKSAWILSLYSFLNFLLIFKILKKTSDKILRYLLDSFSILKKPPKELIVLFLLSTLGYISDAAIFYFLSLSIGNPLSFIKSFLAQLISALTYLVPAGPGYVGSAEASGLLVFSGVFGMEPNLASALTVLFHIVIAIWTIGFGIICVYFLKIEPGKILGKVFKKS